MQNVRREPKRQNGTMFLLAGMPFELEKKVHCIRGEALQMPFESANLAVNSLAQKWMPMQSARDHVPAELLGHSAGFYVHVRMHPLFD